MAKKGQKFKSYTKEFKMKVIFEKVHEEKSYLYLANKSAWDIFVVSYSSFNDLSIIGGRCMYVLCFLIIII